jgi:cell division protein FtsW
MVVEKTKKYFLINLGIILIIGIIMVYSSSYIYAKETFGDSTHFFIKQIIFLIIGSFIALIIAKTKASFWYKNSIKINYFFTALLALTFTPLGITIKGSQRWISLGGFSVQPGEFVKYSTLLAAIYLFNEYSKMEKEGLYKAIGSIAAPLFLFMLQPDYGSFSISLILIFFACFISDFSRKYFIGSGILGISAMGLLLFSAPYRVKRFLTFLDPWSDPQNAGFQIIQSYLAFANGHIFGQGIGNSNEKLFYLPEAYNDFILSVIGEELGYIGVLFIISLFTTLVYFGFRLALNAQAKINQQIITAFMFAIGFQAFLNMGVVLGLLPTKGLNLPFISYGGSSLIANCILIGFVFSAINTKSQIAKVQDSDQTYYSEQQSFI